MKTSLTMRLSERSLLRLREIAAQGPYQITQTSVVEHGIDLAYEEMKSSRSSDLNQKQER